MPFFIAMTQLRGLGSQLQTWYISSFFVLFLFVLFLCVHLDFCTSNLVSFFRKFCFNTCWIYTLNHVPKINLNFMRRSSFRSVAWKTNCVKEVQLSILNLYHISFWYAWNLGHWHKSLIYFTVKVLKSLTMCPLWSTLCIQFTLGKDLTQTSR